MRKRAKVCFYIFLICVFCALGILGFFIFNQNPENVLIGSKKFVTFNSVPGAVKYSLSVCDDSEIEHRANYLINKNQGKSDSEYNFNVTVKNDVNETIAIEKYTQKILYSDEKNKIDCSILNYIISFFDGQNIIETRKYKDQIIKNVDSDIFCCVVSEYFSDLFKKDGTYHIKCVAVDSDENEIEDSLTEFDYDYYAYYEKDFNNRDDFFMYGEWYDYIITSKEELKYLVWHTILYHKNNVSFFNRCKEITSSNINNLVIGYINDYPEYDGLNDENTFATLNENVGNLINFDYYLDENFTKTYKDLKNLDSSHKYYDKAIQYLYEKDESFNVDYITKEETDRNFAINSTIEGETRDEVLVYNTEQLFMVVEYGAKPIFDDTSSVAYIVYQNALNELVKINNSDLLSDYEKALNIYRYICENVVYDYVTYEYMYFKNDYSILSFGNFSCFYLEGVFYDLDNQYAVCDGLSKAYSLLCNIEGIKCVKVNGSVQSDNHAWNKVCLTDDELGLDGWYKVDTTWGVATYSEKVGFKTDRYEILTHTYFLDFDDSQREVKFEAFAESSSENDYYKLTKYNYNSEINDFYIENDEELIKIVDYVESLILNGDESFILEFRYDEDYFNDSNGFVNKFINLDRQSNNFSYPMEMARYQTQIDNWFSDVGLSNLIDCDWFIVEDSNVILMKFFSKI